MGQLQGYTLGETVYEGPETRIRRASHPEAAVPLVVKVPVAATPSLRIVGRLVHEHLLLQKLAQLPGVVRTRGLLQQDGSAALILEDPGLRSLDRVLADRGRLDLGAALQVARELCRVLEGVHAAGVMHKDLKPHKGATRQTGLHSIRSGVALAQRARICHTMPHAERAMAMDFSGRSGWRSCPGLVQPRAGWEYRLTGGDAARSWRGRVHRRQPALQR